MNINKNKFNTIILNKKGFLFCCITFLIFISFIIYNKESIISHISKYQYSEEYNFTIDFLSTFKNGSLNSLDRYFLTHDTFNKFIASDILINELKQFDYYVYGIGPIVNGKGIGVSINRKDKKKLRWCCFSH